MWGRAVTALAQGMENLPRSYQHRSLHDGEAVREALILLWEASDRVCGKRLKALLPVLIAAMERHGRLEVDPVVRTAVTAMSAATIDRALAPCREASGRRRRWPSAGVPSIRREIPVRTFADWWLPNKRKREASAGICRVMTRDLGAAGHRRADAASHPKLEPQSQSKRRSPAVPKCVRLCVTFAHERVRFDLFERVSFRLPTLP